MPDRKTIDPSNANQAYRYLLTVMESPGRRRQFSFARQAEEARTELEQLLPEQLRDEHLLRGKLRFDPTRLESWCLRWLSEEDRTRMWRALRQQDYKQRHRIKRLALPHRLYVRLSIYAEDEGLTLAAAVDQLLTLAANDTGRYGGSARAEPPFPATPPTL
jgi:macrodomain Ter protein organizer (MatP/YcbG family)